MRICVRRMVAEDLEAVRALESASFDATWPATAFEHELTKNPAARYVVVEDGGRTVAFGGLWLQFDQAHIVTVAVEPALRRGGIGRLAVHALVVIADAFEMGDVTLEVRESNQPARGLYRAYGFYDVGRRKRYYADNGEDAVIMTTEPLRSPAYQARLRGLLEDVERRFGSGVAAQLDGERLGAGETATG
ncbi:MAG: ribosomal protein S18-alanine N-acetyltransferase [Dehalococcoidia bacterium]|nr:ribosomal protein S18-alanine N-acetyltransferase [Dehalococcoidia bacterium]MCA9830564.1 ribosomal protein S18-alanine N-acetyltransferase [Dehalococcoidia bacterium]MCB9485543.1 ribosomal protein S18-alanine N-acetyltransferase [Thermoflexaceae bacterium]